MINPDQMIDAKIAFAGALFMFLMLTILPQTEIQVPSGIGVGLVPIGKGRTL